MILAFDDLAVALPEFELAIDGTFEAESLGVFGPSGAGKTTLLEAIAGLRSIARGTISIDGREISSLAARARHVGYVPQDETLFPHMSVRANIEYGVNARAGTPASSPAGTPASGRRRSAPAGRRPALLFDDIAPLLEIEALMDRRVAKLSGGERRRVAIARALMSGPALLLLDEPLAGLDAALRQRTIELLLAVRSHFAVPLILVSHERDEVERLCSRAIVLDRGRVVAEGPPAEVL